MTASPRLHPRSRSARLALGLLLCLASSCGDEAPRPPAELQIEPALAPTEQARELALATDARGVSWLAFLDQPTIASAKNASLMVMMGTTRAPQAAAEGPAIGPATIAALEGGGVLVVWEARSAAGRALFGRTASAGAAGALQFGPVEEIPTGDSGPLMPHAAALPGGGIGLVWQVLEGARYGVRFMQRDRAGMWSEPIEVSSDNEGAGDAWRPRLAAAPDGRVLVAYDRFVPGETGGFDVMLATAVAPGQPFARQLIAGGPTYQGLPELGVDGEGVAWISYEEAPSFGQGGSLRSRRQTRLAAVDAKGSLSHALLPQNLSTEQRGDFPRLLVTDQGLALTRRLPMNDYEPRSASRKPFYATWHTRVLGFDEHGEGHDLELDATDGDNENDARLHLGPEGFGLYFASDDRSATFGARYSFEVPIQNPWHLFHARLPIPVGFPRLAPGPPPPLRQAWAEPLRQGLAIAERDPRALFGDLHRHTDLSRCAGRQDGTTLDAVRYARGPGALDFLSITDHYQHLTPASAWREARDVERWNAPGSLVMLPGLERMITTAGHQNLIFDSPMSAQKAGLDSPPKQQPVGTVIAIPHMSSMERNPFDWSRLDPDVQRLVEVHQGRRGSYEGQPIGHAPEPEGLQGQATWPVAAFDSANDIGWITRLASSLPVGATPPGLISSSDHASSNAGFCGITLALGAPRELTRAAVFGALLARQTFASTGPAPGAKTRHRLALSTAQDALTIDADMQGLVSLTIIENGAELAVLTSEQIAPLHQTLVVRAHFGLSTKRQFDISAEGATLRARGFSQDRPELTAATESATKSPTIGLELFPDEPADFEVLIDIAATNDASPTLRFDLTWERDRQPALGLDLPLATLQASPTRRFFLGPNGTRPYFDAELLPTPTLGKTQVTYDLKSRPKDAIYYVRAAWSDGHHAWSRMMRGK